MITLDIAYSLEMTLESVMRVGFYRIDGSGVRAPTSIANPNTIGCPSRPEEVEGV